MKELSNCITSTDEEYGFFCIIDYDYTEPQQTYPNKNIEKKFIKLFNNNNKKTSKNINTIIDDFNCNNNNSNNNNINNNNNKIIKNIYMCAILITMAFSVYQICRY